MGFGISKKSYCCDMIIISESRIPSNQINIKQNNNNNDKYDYIMDNNENNNEIFKYSNFNNDIHNNMNFDSLNISQQNNCIEDEGFKNKKIKRECLNINKLMIEKENINVFIHMMKIHFLILIIKIKIKLTFYSVII